MLLLQILLFAQHVSGTTMPIIRSSRVLYSGCCLWYFVLWFSSCWSGVELRVMCPDCRMLSCWSGVELRVMCPVCRMLPSFRKPWHSCYLIVQKIGILPIKSSLSIIIYYLSTLKQVALTLLSLNNFARPPYFNTNCEIKGRHRKPFPSFVKIA